MFLDLRILNELRGHFSDVRILRGLGLESRLAVGRQRCRGMCQAFELLFEITLMKISYLVTFGQGPIRDESVGRWTPRSLVDFGWMWSSERKSQPQDPGSKNGTWGTLRVSSDYEREKPSYASHAPSWNGDNSGPTLAKTARMGHPPAVPRRAQCISRKHACPSA